MTTIVEKTCVTNKNKKVEINDDGYGVSLLVSRNGYQYSGCGIDADLIELILEALNEYKEIVNE